MASKHRRILDFDFIVLSTWYEYVRWSVDFDFIVLSTWYEYVRWKNLQMTFSLFQAWSLITLHALISILYVKVLIEEQGIEHWNPQIKDTIAKNNLLWVFGRRILKQWDCHKIHTLEVLRLQGPQASWRTVHLQWRRRLVTWMRWKQRIQEKTNYNFPRLQFRLWIVVWILKGSEFWRGWKQRIQEKTNTWVVCL